MTCGELFGFHQADMAESPQDREHCRLDLDSVSSPGQALRFIMAWRPMLRELLINPPQDPAITAELEQELKEATDTADRLANAMADARIHISRGAEFLYEDTPDIGAADAELTRAEDELFNALKREEYL